MWATDWVGGIWWQHVEGMALIHLVLGLEQSQHANVRIKCSSLCKQHDCWDVLVCLYVVVIDSNMQACVPGKPGNVYITLYVVKSVYMCNIRLCKLHILLFAAITCSPLSSVTNGNIVYSRDTTTTFTFSTVATYSCNEGFLLLGNNEQRCSGDGSSVNGLWSGGSTPVCTGVVLKIKV